MNKRICPDEITLSEYYCGKLRGEERLELERHLASCGICRGLLSETNEILRAHRRGGAYLRLWERIRKNLWLFGAVAFLGASFLVPKHFLQFLAIGFLMGVKWIIDSKTTKMLITVYEALRRPGWQNTDKRPSRSREMKH